MAKCRQGAELFELVPSKFLELLLPQKNIAHNVGALCSWGYLKNVRPATALSFEN